MTDVFISYSTRYPVYADMIEEDLERDHYKCWRDRSKLRGGTKWKKEIENAIQQSTIIVVLITKYVSGSRWIKYELNFAASLNKPCIPLIMDVFQNNGETLQKLGVNEDQAINFVTLGRRVAYSELLECVKQYTDEWRPLAESRDNLSHFSSRVRQKAVDDLANSKDIRVITILQKAFEVEDQEYLSRHIFEKLGEFNDRRVVQMSLDILGKWSRFSDLDGLVGTAVVILQRWGPYYPDTNDVLLSLLDRVELISFVCEILRNYGASVQKQAIKILSRKILSTEGAAVFVGGLVNIGKRGQERLKEIIERPDFPDRLKEYAETELKLHRSN